MKIVLTLTLAICASAPLLANAETSLSDLPPDLAKHVDELSMEFGETLYRSFQTLDDDGDGRVSLKSVLQLLMSRGFARPGGPVPEYYEGNGLTERYRRGHADADKDMIKRIKQDDAGLVGIEELISAARIGLVEQASRQIPLDVDKNGKLDLQEYSVGYPIRKDQVVEEDGFTKQQKQGFAAQDLNHDGFIAGEEWISRYIPRARQWINGVQLTILIDQLDKNANNELSPEELQAIVPEARHLNASVPMKESRYMLRELDADSLRMLAEALAPLPAHSQCSSIRWSPVAATRYGEEVVIHYRAAIFGKKLVVEGKITDGWRTYAMDNPYRAMKASGPDAMSEKPTRITLDSSVKPAGEWRQSAPNDFSKPEMEWYTWGFKDTVYFTRELADWPDQDFSIIINAQICNDASCAMANDITLKVPHAANAEAPPVPNTVETLDLASS